MSSLFYEYSIVFVLFAVQYLALFLFIVAFLSWISWQPMTILPPRHCRHGHESTILNPWEHHGCCVHVPMIHPSLGHRCHNLRICQHPPSNPNLTATLSAVSPMTNPPTHYLKNWSMSWLSIAFPLQKKGGRQKEAEPMIFILCCCIIFVTAKSGT